MTDSERAEMARMADACTAACLLGRHYHPEPWLSIPLESPTKHEHLGEWCPACVHHGWLLHVGATLGPVLNVDLLTRVLREYGLRVNHDDADRILSALADVMWPVPRHVHEYDYRASRCVVSGLYPPSCDECIECVAIDRCACGFERHPADAPGADGEEPT